MPRKKPRNSSKRATLKDLPVKADKATRARGGSLVQSDILVSPVVAAAPSETQMESRKFQTLVNVTKARQDIALNSINNAK